jgi:hypothetical protein
MNDKSLSIRHSSFVILGRLGLFGLIAMLGQAAYAHPGHSLTEHGLVHVVSSPFHVLFLAAMAAVLWCAGLFVRHAIGRCLLRFGAGAALAAAVVLWSFIAA